MVRRGYIIAIAIMLLVNGAFASFVQDPIPPSSQKNYFMDYDNNGRMDHLVIRFLGDISKDYINKKLDSLTIDWIDSAGEFVHMQIPSRDFLLDTTSRRGIVIDLAKWQNEFFPLTGLSAPEFFDVSYGTCKLFLKEGVVYNILVKDGMPPSAFRYRLRKRMSGGSDTLDVTFTEKAKLVNSCDAYLEFKSSKDSVVRVLPSSDVKWNAFNNVASFIFDEDAWQEERLSLRDSVRLLSSCIKDSLGNAVKDDAAFGLVDGNLPFEIFQQPLVYDYNLYSGENNIFKLTFEEPTAKVPNDTAWGISMEILGSNFESTIRESLGMKSSDMYDERKVTVDYSLRIYTNLGSFVANTKYKIKGDDRRFDGAAKKLFLRWNLMDANYRRVSSGAYLANIAVVIRYDGKVVYHSEKDGVSTQVFGVLRR